jgi:predicted nucleic acid-binding protein
MQSAIGSNGPGASMPSSAKRVYLDVCALSRPFDDQSQMRIRLEADAVQLILSYIRSGDLALIVSPMHNIEIGAIGDLAEREQLLSTLRQIGQRVSFDPQQARTRAEQLTQRGLGPADAAHLAFAEEAQADFVTCDDRLLRRYQRAQPRIWSGTPVAFCSKEDLL